MGAARPDPVEDLDRAAVSYVRAWEHAGAAERGALRDDLIGRCLPFVDRLTRRYSGRREPLDGLHEVALLALITAVDRYGPWRGSFTTFALITISGEIRRHIRDQSWRPTRAELARHSRAREHETDVPPGRLTVTELVGGLPGRIQPIVAGSLAGEKPPAQIAELLGVSPAQVPALLRQALTWLRASVLSTVPPPWTGPEEDGRESLRIDLRHDDPLTTVRVDGEVDRDTADLLRRRLHAALSLAAPGRLVVDLAGVPFLDAAGAAVLLELRLAGSVSEVEVQFTGAQPYVAAVLAVVGLPAGVCVAAG